MGGSIVLPITAAIVGPAASGIFRAQSILFMPVYQFWWAMAALLVPRVAEIGAKHPADRLRATALQIVAVLAALATAYSAVLLVWGSNLLMLAYRKTEIAAASRLLWPLSICTVVDAVTAAVAIVLVASGVTRLLFWARVASATVLLAGAFWLGPAFGLDAIAWAAAAGSAVCASIHVLALATTLRARQSRIGIGASGAISDLAMSSPPSLDGRGTS
jgi:O-antigen/teichoic acid export membrane protein